MNTPGSSKSCASDPGRLPQTPTLISERYNVSEPPLSTRLERIQSTPRLQLKSAPKVVKSMERRFASGRSVMGSPYAQVVSSVNRNSNLSPLYDTSKSNSYFEQIFHCEEKIGQGSFGQVFRVKDKQTGQLYAIKCSNEPYRTVQNRREKQHEVEMHEKVPKHENLVEFICAWEEKDWLYIQTELCEMSLENHLYKYVPLPEWRVWDIFLDLVKAVDHLDKLNIIHADIKPENILVAFNGVCKLGDFGLMVDLETEKIEDWHEGDSKYLAREVLNSRITKEATIFSLGLSILQVATDLHLPPYGDRWQEVRDLNIDPRFTAHLTPELVELIYSMMAINPAERPRIGAVFNSPLLRDHDANYRDWNKRFYSLFRDFYGNPFGSAPTGKG